MNLNCHCYSCNVHNPANVFILPNNEDKQNLILLICKKIFEAIQNGHTSTEISYDESTMKHKQLRSIYEINDCINEEFGQLFRNNVLRKEMKKFSVYTFIVTWRIEFKWAEFNNDSLIKGLLEISKEWYDSFTQHLQKVDYQKRSALSLNREMDKNEELKQLLLDNLNDYLPGFEYLLEYSWESCDYDYDYNRNKGGLVFASDYGIFVVVEVKWLNERNMFITEISRDDVRTQASKHKKIALEKFNGKYITVLGATFTNNLDENSWKEATLEFIDNDEIIIQYVKEACGFSRRYNELQLSNNRSYNRQTSTTSTFTQQAKKDSSSGLSNEAVVGIAAVAAIAGVAAAGYLAYQAVKTPKRRAMLGAGITLFQALNNELSKDDDDDKFSFI